MSHHRKTNHKKSSSPSSSSSYSSENNLWKNIEQPLRRTSQSSTSSSSGSSIKRPIYPNVPKRTRQSSFLNDHDIIQTESRIDIIPSEIHSEKANEYSSIRSLSNQNAYTRHTLDLITKYTSPQKKFQEPSHRPLSPVQSEMNILSNSQPIYGSKYKRALSPLDETNQQIHESKRTKSFDEDDDDEEISVLLDYRRNKQISSQNNNTTISSQSTIDGEQRKPTVRKPTVRKLSATQQKPIMSQPIPIERPIENTSVEPQETLIIEADIDDTEEENIINRDERSWLSKRSQILNTHYNRQIESGDHINHSLSTPIIPSPIKLPIDNCIDSLNSNIKQNVLCTPTKTHTSILSSKKTRENLIDNLSPCSNSGGRGGERRFSSTSSSSLFFDTPNSSFSRMTTNNTTSTPQIVKKLDRETQISFPSNNDMINKLISQMNLNMNDNKNEIDYNPTDLSKKLFHQSTSFSSNNKYQSSNFIIKKQFLNFGRYEIEILFPIDHDKNPTIYACDICLKHFHGSLTAFQRHTAKCLYTHPPGKLILTKDDLAIFQIGKTHMNMEQRIYVKSLCRIVRLFMDSNKSIDDTKINRFVYYILCRRDPILSQSQCSVYRLIGYFSKQINQYGQQLIHNLSCLFILPPFIQDHQYNQLLIAFSYFLIRSNTSASLMYSSPARPLDIITLSAFQIYWRDILFAYIINHNHSSIKSFALDIFARQTSIHPRDILSSLYYNGFIVPHPTDKSSVYLLNKAYHSMTSLNLHTKNKFLFMDMNLISIDDEKNIIIDKQNIDKNHDSGIDEIVLD